MECNLCVSCLPSAGRKPRVFSPVITPRIWMLTCESRHPPRAAQDSYLGHWPYCSFPSPKEAVANSVLTLPALPPSPPHPTHKVSMLVHENPHLSSTGGLSPACKRYSHLCFGFSEAEDTASGGQSVHQPHRVCSFPNTLTEEGGGRVGAGAIADFQQPRSLPTSQPTC